MLRDETPEPVEISEWYAVSTGNQDALAQAFGMVDARSVTMRRGIELIGAWSPGSASVTYFSPELDGWTLVFGYPLPGIGNSSEPLRTFLCHLSRRFGTACWYGSDYGLDGWALAENGELTRLFAEGELGRDEIGPPHPAEAPSWPPTSWPPLPEELATWPTCDPATVAERTSLNPVTLGSHTGVRGHAVVAVSDVLRSRGLSAGTD
ncbi:hypothetical protein [Nocardia iowensis]|uniref:GNAT family N-acetyltransferase n=1 Tax=Nocardia iowensis TaxID=204891 RepID=A0ABX8S3Z3_NOCIO|nr:hypothetical protein [Nocardia iowensis]QXN94621.1 hypothetical protein KV110_17140 [Nocardia iowensis]